MKKNERIGLVVLLIIVIALVIIAYIVVPEPTRKVVRSPIFDFLVLAFICAGFILTLVKKKEGEEKKRRIMIVIFIVLIMLYVLVMCL